MIPRVLRPANVSTSRTIEAQQYLGRLLNDMGESASFAPEGLGWARRNRLRVFKIGRKWIQFNYVRWEDEYLPAALIEYAEKKQNDDLHD